MSLFERAVLTCPDCRHKSEVERCASVNADRRPDLRAAILDGSFQAAVCPQCGTELRLPPLLTYLELGRNIWLAAQPAPQIDQWPSVEEYIFQIYDRSFGRGAAPAAKELGAALLPRLVFGWPALREKLLCHDLGLDDVTLELLKMSVIRNVDGSPLSDQTELRLIGGDADRLDLQWVVAETEEPLAQLAVPREIYQAIEADPEPWQAARAKFAHVFLVDLRRLLAGPAAEAA